MNDLKIFKNKEFGNLRAVEIDGAPWFVGKDVATALGYSNTSKAILMHVDEEDRKIQKSQNGSFENVSNRGLQIINESGLYSLILSSKLKTAKKFKHWVTSEVLPAIRTHGAYMTDEKAYDITHSKASLIDLLQQAADQLRENEHMKRKLKRKILRTFDFADIAGILIGASAADWTPVGIVMMMIFIPCAYIGLRELAEKTSHEKSR